MINIGLCGFGTVGSGVYNIIKENEYLKQKFKIIKVLVHSLNKKRNIDNNLLTTNYKDIVNNKDIDIVIEVIGGKTKAFDIIKESLSNKKDVITANKEIISLYLKELSEIANKNCVNLYFEASVCAAIPIVNTIFNISKTDQIYSISGIVNGSTNYILTNLYNGSEYEKVIDEAFNKGFLESDPTDDLKGYDALRKIIILSYIAYDCNFDIKKCHLQEMSTITNEFVEYLKKEGYKVKYLASSKKDGDNISIRVEPVIISRTEDMYNCDYEENCVEIITKYSKKIFLKGLGAGSLPTASAILMDLNNLYNNNYHNLTYDNNLKISDSYKSKYIFESLNSLKSKYIEKVCGNFYYSKEIDDSVLNSLIKESICYARIKY